VQSLLGVIFDVFCVQSLLEVIFDVFYVQSLLEVIFDVFCMQSLETNLRRTFKATPAGILGA
jgi:hypothetical protein